MLLKKIGRIILKDYVNDSLLYFKIPKHYYDEVINNKNEILLEI